MWIYIILKQYLWNQKFETWGFGPPLCWVDKILKNFQYLKKTIWKRRIFFYVWFAYNLSIYYKFHKTSFLITLGCYTCNNISVYDLRTKRTKYEIVKKKFVKIPPKLVFFLDIFLAGGKSRAERAQAYDAPKLFVWYQK